MNGLALSEREQQLLRTLVRMYIRGGQPVGSRTLVQESGVPVSPATVRAVMSELEARGFVQTPHTSAGRVPTARAYRFFIDTLVTMQSLHDEDIEDIRHQLDPDKTTPRAGRRSLQPAVTDHPSDRSGDGASRR